MVPERTQQRRDFDGTLLLRHVYDVRKMQALLRIVARQKLEFILHRHAQIAEGGHVNHFLKQSLFVESIWNDNVETTDNLLPFSS